MPDDQKTKDRRRPIVAALHKQEFTQEVIAQQLSVSQPTIARDLATLFTVNNVKGKGKDTLGRKKSTGRPKSTKPPKAHPTHDQIVAVADTGKSQKEIANELGIAPRVVRRELESEAIARKAKAEPDIDRSELSLTAQEKLDLAIRQATKRLEIEIEARKREEYRLWLDQVCLPQYHKELTDLEWKIRGRKGMMTRVNYKKVLSCLHPDRVNDPALKKRYEEAFQLFTEMEKIFLDEKQSPTELRKMPRTYEELMTMKAKVQAERRAKRHNSSTIRTR